MRYTLPFLTYRWHEVSPYSTAALRSHVRHTTRIRYLT